MSCTARVGQRVRLLDDEDIDWMPPPKPWTNYRNKTGIIAKILWMSADPARHGLSWEPWPDILVVLDNGDEVEINVDLVRDLTPLELLAQAGQ